MLLRTSWAGVWLTQPSGGPAQGEGTWKVSQGNIPTAPLHPHRFPPSAPTFPLWGAESPSPAWLSFLQPSSLHRTGPPSLSPPPPHPQDLQLPREDPCLNSAELAGLTTLPVCTPTPSVVVLNKGFALRNAVTAVIFLKPRNTWGPASLCSGNRQEGLFFIHGWF